MGPSAHPITAAPTEPGASQSPPRVSTNLGDLALKIRAEFAGRTPPTWEAKLPPAGVRPRGVMLTIHGGAWFIVGPQTIRSMDADVERWRQRGFVTVNIDYQPGPNSAADVADFYDAIANWQGAAVPIGATGRSAGGHLSMLLAAQRPGLDFAVSMAGPSDLTRLAGSTAASQSFQGSVNQMFGAHRARYSPARRGAQMGAELLVAGARNDELVIPANVEYMRAARPGHVEAVILPPGNVQFVHSKVNRGALQDLYRREARLADRVAPARF